MPGLGDTPAKIRVDRQSIPFDKRYLSKVIGQNTGSQEPSDTTTNNDSMLKGWAAGCSVINYGFRIH
jgi:hypothetical protein